MPNAKTLTVDADADTDGGCVQPAGADNEVLTQLPGNLSPIS